MFPCVAAITVPKHRSGNRSHTGSCVQRPRCFFTTVKITEGKYLTKGTAIPNKTCNIYGHFRDSNADSSTYINHRVFAYTSQAFFTSKEKFVWVVSSIHTFYPICVFDDCFFLFVNLSKNGQRDSTTPISSVVQEHVEIGSYMSGVHFFHGFSTEQGCF